VSAERPLVTVAHYSIKLKELSTYYYPVLNNLDFCAFKYNLALLLVLFDNAMEFRNNNKYNFKKLVIGNFKSRELN
jgi:hypothetical protein